MKRLIAMFLATLMVLSSSPAVLAADEPSFSDVPASHWAFGEIERAVDSGIINGYSDGTFKPTNNVTYGHFAALLARTFYPDEIRKLFYGEDWSSSYFEILYGHNITNGTLIEHGFWASFRDLPIKRYEMAQMMYNVVIDRGCKISAQPNDGDFSDISQEYRTAVSVCYNQGLLNGQSDGTFGGEKPMNRAQACVVISRLQKYLAENANVPPYQTLTNGKAAIVENVLEIIEQIKKEYPEGTGWGGSNTPSLDGGFINTTPIGKPNHTYTDSVGSSIGSLIGSFGTSSSVGCGGFAAMVSDRIFGKSAPFRVLVDHSQIRPGDVVQYIWTDTGRDRHWAVAVSTADSYGRWQTADGNVVTANGGIVSWPNEYSSGVSDETIGTTSAIVIYTRYRDEIADAATSDISPAEAVREAIEKKKLQAEEDAANAKDIYCANCGYLMQKAGSLTFDTNSNPAKYRFCEKCRDFFVCGQCMESAVFLNHIATCQG